MELIDKSIVVAEIERQLHYVNSWLGSNKGVDGRKSNIYFRMIGNKNVLEDIKDFINTLETKEVNLDFQTFAKEMDAVFNLPSTETTNTEEEPLNWEYAIARHFYKLGLNAKEG